MTKSTNSSEEQRLAPKKLYKRITKNTHMLGNGERLESVVE